MVDGASGDKYVWDMIYREVAPPSRMRWSSIWVEGFADNRETIATVEFREVPGGTEVTLVHEGFPDKATRDGHAAGWGGSLDKLARFLS